MVKAKTSGAPATSNLSKSLDSQFSKALGLLEAKNYEDAAEILKAMQGPAKESGNLGLERTVRTYLSVCATKTAKAPKGHAAAEAEAEMLLNHQNPKAALVLLDKASKAAPTHATLHYLKAIAHAQQGEAEAAADALNRAMLLDGDLLHVYRLEPDFDEVRNQAPFAAIERL